MTNENIVKRLRDAGVCPALYSDHFWRQLLNEAADEIEYLRQRCEQIDQEWRQTMEGRNGK
jgi:predicted secreted protein